MPQSIRYFSLWVISYCVVNCWFGAARSHSTHLAGFCLFKIWFPVGHSYRGHHDSDTWNYELSEHLIRSYILTWLGHCLVLCFGCSNVMNFWLQTGPAHVLTVSQPSEIPKILSQPHIRHKFVRTCFAISRQVWLGAIAWFRTEDDLGASYWQALIIACGHY
jgi:hypothetical protein